MSFEVETRRVFNDRLMRGACVAASVVVLVPLVGVLGYVVKMGIGGFSFDYFTHLPTPVGEDGGGFGQAIVGSLALVGLGCAIALPLGILVGVALAEFGEGRLPKVIRFTADVMTGLPSIVVGIFIYKLIVAPMKSFSALAGGAALAVVMFPIVVRTTEELLRLVPGQLREAGLALGVSQWRVILRVVLRTAAPGVMTGALLAIARAAGETAPLLFTALNSRYWPSGLLQPTASLPVHIYTYALSPYEEWHRQAWAAALILVVAVLTLNLTARFISRTKKEFR